MAGAYKQRRRCGCASDCWGDDSVSNAPAWVFAQACCPHCEGGAPVFFKMLFGCSHVVGGETVTEPVVTLRKLCQNGCVWASSFSAPLDFEPGLVYATAATGVSAEDSEDLAAEGWKLEATGTTTATATRAVTGGTIVYECEAWSCRECSTFVLSAATKAAFPDLPLPERLAVTPHAAAENPPAIDDPDDYTGPSRIAETAEALCACHDSAKCLADLIVVGACEEGSGTGPMFRYTGSRGLDGVRDCWGGETLSEWPSGVPDPSTVPAGVWTNVCEPSFVNIDCLAAGMLSTIPVGLDTYMWCDGTDWNVKAFCIGSGEVTVTNLVVEETCFGPRISWTYGSNACMGCGGNGGTGGDPPTPEPEVPTVPTPCCPGEIPQSLTAVVKFRSGSPTGTVFSSATVGIAYGEVFDPGLGFIVKRWEGTAALSANVGQADTVIVKIACRISFGSPIIDTNVRLIRSSDGAVVSFANGAQGVGPDPGFASCSPLYVRTVVQIGSTWVELEVTE